LQPLRLLPLPCSYAATRAATLQPVQRSCNPKAVATQKLLRKSCYAKGHHKLLRKKGKKGKKEAKKVTVSTGNKRKNKL
jgi:hypothetical protein